MIKEIEERLEDIEHIVINQRMTIEEAKNRFPDHVYFEEALKEE